MDPQEISPELVLVSPELAEIARAALPDRPWERFAPPRPPEPAPVAVVAAPPAPAPPRPKQRTPSLLGRVAALTPAVVLAGFVAVLVVGSFPIWGERPVLEPPGASNPPAIHTAPVTIAPVPATPRPPVVAPPKAATARPLIHRAIERTRRASTLPRHATRPEAKVAKPKATAKPPTVPPVAAATAPGPLRGTYAISRAGTLVVVGVPARISVLRTSLPCVGVVVIRDVAIASTGAFSASLDGVGPAQAAVRLTGGFVDASTVSAQLRAGTAGCDSGPISFTARRT